MSDIDLTDLLERIIGCINNAEYDDEQDTLTDAFAVIEAQAAEIEKLREALRDIQIEAERERGNWTHLKQVIARKARAALGETK
jgi:hypothetical protein